MIKAAHLSKNFRKTTAVDDISFEVETGKVTGFLGPNGAGKSTTMRLMLGLASGPGSTKFDGKRLSNYAEPSKVVGILLEAKAYHPTRTPRNHLKILATAGNIPATRVDEVLEIVGLKDVAKKAPGKFSLGMSQRMGIAAAILAKPKHLLLDEPANGLDPEGIVWLREFLKAYADDGNSVFVSSHLLSEMSQMADNVIVIGKGKLIASTSIKSLVSGNAKSSVYVRAGSLTKLEKIMQDKSKIAKPVDGGLEISGATTDEIGKLAYGAGITVLELANRHASLEDVFLELTEGSEEFKAHDQKGGNL
ncbi:MAG TPA: ATP-binding cassette domain-containing protein [Patescibacteria group bacterium]|jgi:ABC-2 type transport system ATP-binding protein|nr:ATP-binding cassette domain-containing protein [Patescibacteria group bacterium]